MKCCKRSIWTGNLINHCVCHRSNRAAQQRDHQSICLHSRVTGQGNALHVKVCPPPNRWLPINHTHAFPSTSNNITNVTYNPSRNIFLISPFCPMRATIRPSGSAFGMIVLLLLVSCMLHLVVTAYFFVLEMLGDQVSRPANITDAAIYIHTVVFRWARDYALHAQMRAGSATAIALYVCVRVCVCLLYPEWFIHNLHMKWTQRSPGNRRTCFSARCSACGWPFIPCDCWWSSNRVISHRWR